MTLLHVLLCTWRLTALRVLLRFMLLTPGVGRQKCILHAKVGAPQDFRAQGCKLLSIPNSA
jgi:hypothetical protein